MQRTIICCNAHTLKKCITLIDAESKSEDHYWQLLLYSTLKFTLICNRKKIVHKLEAHAGSKMQNLRLFQIPGGTKLFFHHHILNLGCAKSSQIVFLLAFPALDSAYKCS